MPPPTPRTASRAVDHQVHHRVLQLRPVGADQRDRAAIVGLQPDVLAQQAAQQDLEIHQGVGEVDGLAFGRRLAREGEELADQGRRPDHGVLDLAQVVVGRIAQRMAQQEFVGAQSDRAQQVVEIVGDAAGELADRLHLVALGELELHRLLVGDVEGVGRPAGAGRRQIEVGDALRRSGEGNLDRAAGIGGVSGFGFDARRRKEEVAEADPRSDRAAGHRLELGVGLQQRRGDRVTRSDHGRAERRRLGETRRRGQRGRDGFGAVADGVQFQKEMLVAQGRDTNVARSGRGRDDPRGVALAAGLDEGAEQRIEAAQPGRRIHRIPPGAVRRDDPAVGVAEGDAVLQALEHGRHARRQSRGGAAAWSDGQPHLSVTARLRAA